jgi:hypothetical protein
MNIGVSDVLYMFSNLSSCVSGVGRALFSVGNVSICFVLVRGFSNLELSCGMFSNMSSIESLCWLLSSSFLPRASSFVAFPFCTRVRFGLGSSFGDGMAFL